MKKPSMGSPKIMHHVAKGSRQQILPNRHAMSTLTKGDPVQRSMNNYAQETPGVGNESPDINQMAGGMGGGSNFKCGGMV